MAFLAVRAIRSGITGAVHAYQDGKNPDGPQSHLNRRGKPQRGLIYSGMYELVSAIDGKGKGKGKSNSGTLSGDIDQTQRTVSPSESKSLPPSSKAPYAVPPTEEPSNREHRDGNLHNPFNEEQDQERDNREEEEEEEEEGEGEREIRETGSMPTDPPPPYPGSSTYFAPVLPPRSPSQPTSYPTHVDIYGAATYPRDSNMVSSSYPNHGVNMGMAATAPIGTQVLTTYGRGMGGYEDDLNIYGARPHHQLHRRDRRRIKAQHLAMMEQQQRMMMPQQQQYQGLGYNERY